jgi:malate dehydrogenase (oxaloacetate-decarboxylating)(NADP+)
MANPDPEIDPDEAKAVRPDCIIATGRSDYPNQVNNVLGLPFIFRGALGVGSTPITNCGEMHGRRSARTSTRPTSLAGW